MVQERDFLDVSYCQNNWKENSGMVQDGLCLMGFDDDKNLYTRAPCQIWVQIIKTTW